MVPLYTVKQAAKEIPGETEAAIRWNLFNKDKNGLAASGAVLKIGRRILIDLPLYVEWLKSHSLK